MTETSQPIFRDLNPDDPEPEMTEIESLCMNCYEKGVTRLLLTKIPFYKEVVIMSFACEECGYQNNEIQPGGKIEAHGCKFEVKIETPKDLNRKVVKSDYCSIMIEELQFEIPPQSQKGEVTTVEGVIDRVVRGLEQDQAIRRTEHPEVASQIDEFIRQLNSLKKLEKPFNITLQDASGNSFIENYLAPKADPQMKISFFKRSKEQNEMLGMFEEAIDSAASKPKDKNVLEMIPEGSFPLEEFDKEVLQFQTRCPECCCECETNMKVTNIPHFKEVVIMASLCENCGYRSNEVKCGGGVEEKGVKIEVKIGGKEDFARDILKSDFCSLSIPEIECDVGPHALGGRFTTVEGILKAMREQLTEQSGMFFDSRDEAQKLKMDEFFKKLDMVLENKLEATLILDDPTGNSYIQSLTDDLKDDEKLRFSHYHRSYEQNEELGLNDMKTENYNEDENNEDGS